MKKELATAHRVDDPRYWKSRTEFFDPEHDPRRMLWMADDGAWDRMEESHRKILATEVTEKTSILDVGCGTARLIKLLPEGWKGYYLGFDVSPDLLKIAKRDNPSKTFIQGDVRELFRGITKKDSRTGIEVPFKFDLTVCCMFRHMVLTQLGEPYWIQVRQAISTVSTKVLILEPIECGGNESWSTIIPPK